MKESLFLSVVYKGQPIMNVKGLALPFIVGSGDMSNLRIRDPYFKDQHFAILKNGNNIIVRDLSGQSDLSLNNISLNEFVVMDSEVFSVGDALACQIGFVLEDQEIATKDKKAETKMDQVDDTMIDLDRPMDTRPVLESDEVSTISLDDSTHATTLDEESRVFILSELEAVKKPVSPSAPVVSSSGLGSSIIHYNQSPMLSNVSQDPVLRKRHRALEANLFWKGKLLESKQLDRGKTLVVGPQGDAGISIPQLSKYRELAKLGKKGVKLNIPANLECKLLKNTDTWGSVIYNPNINKGIFALNHDEAIVVQFDEYTYLYLRLIPMTKALGDIDSTDHDLRIWEVFLSSGFIHLMILILALYISPEPKNVPELDKVPKRFAKLLVKEPPKKIEVPKLEPKPEPKPKPKLEPKPKPKPKQELKPKPKPEPKQPKAKPKKIKKIKKKRTAKKVVAKKATKEINKFPLKLNSTRVAKADTKAKPPANQEFNPNAVGALGALLGPSAGLKNTKVAVNINAKTKETQSPSAISNSLKISKSGNSGNVDRVSTSSGGGVASYGTDNIKGSAGGGDIQGEVGRPKVGSFTNSEGLSSKQVMAVVDKNLGAIQTCYEKSLIRTPDVSGRVEYEWLISANGSVSRAQVKKADLKGDGTFLNECVLKVIRAMKFPKSKNGEVTRPNIGFPFGRY